MGNANAIGHMSGTNRPRVHGATLGQRIVAAMQYAGIGKSALADRIGVRPQTIWNWTKQPNPTTPNSDYVRSIAEVTGVTVEELLGMATGQDPPFAAWKEFLSTSTGQQLGETQRRAMATIAWPDDEEPSLESYMLIASALKAAKKKG